MIKKIKEYIILDCIIFTIMSVVLNLFYITTGLSEKLTVGYIDYSLQLFAVSTTIAVLFFISELIFGQITGIKDHLVSACIVVGTVFVEGGWCFHWLDFNLITILLVLLIIVVVYMTVYFIMFAKNVGDSNEINRKLKQLKEEENE